MSDDALTVIYKAVVLAKILHAVTAWCRFTAATVRHGIEAHVNMKSISDFIDMKI